MSDIHTDKDASGHERGMTRHLHSPNPQPDPEWSKSIPRRNKLYLCTPAERAIFDAMQVVERAGCHPLLTKAVNLLQEARDAVADFVEGVSPAPAPSGEDLVCQLRQRARLLREDTGMTHAPAAMEAGATEIERLRAELERVTGELEVMEGCLGEVRDALDEAGIPASEAFPPPTRGTRILTLPDRASLLATRAREAEGQRDAVSLEIARANAIANEARAESSRLRAAVEEAKRLIDRIWAHGAPHMIDITIKKDDRTHHMQGDWLKDLRRTLSAALSPAPGEAKEEGGIDELRALVQRPETDTLFRIESEGGDVFVVCCDQLRPLFAPSRSPAPAEGEAFCACGRRAPECDGSRAACPTPAPAEGGEA